jgi:DNA primase small subunit
MPHSVSPQDPATLDEIESQPSTTTLVANETQNGDSQSSNFSEADMRMADTDSQEQMVAEMPKKLEEASEVKLEDLFADMDSDEEFPSSAPGVKAEGSPEAPQSPL